MTVKDSGSRQDFGTGAVRDIQKGKGRNDLMPFIALRRLAIHYEAGAEKYGCHNWRKGIPLMRYIDSAIRHIFKWCLFWNDEDHLAAAIWNLCCVLETEELIKRGKLGKELDDRVEQYRDDEQCFES